MSIHHMMAADYYGTPSYGYDTSVTISSKRNVAVLVLDSTKWMPAMLNKFMADQVWCLCILVCDHQANQASKDIPTEIDLLAR
jgi:hypothetical protein